MDTQKLRHFVVAAETGNFRKAADILRISHSGLSKSIAALEGTLGGTELFIREGRGVILTDHGRDVLHRGKDLLKTVDAFLQKAASTAAVKPLRIATFEVFSTYFLGHFVERYWNDRPLELRELVPGPMETAIAIGQADLGITYEPVPTSGVEFLRVTQIRMAVFGLASAINKFDLSSLPFAAPLSPLSGTPTGVKGLDGWPDDKYERNICYAVDMMESALELCRRGKAVVFIPEFIAALHNASRPARYQLSKLDLPMQLDVKRLVYLVKRVGTAEGEAAKLIAKALRELRSVN